MTPAALVALWLVLTLAGGATGTFILLHYVADVRSLAPDVLHLERELAWSRLRQITALVLGWLAFVLLGLSATGVTFHPVLWNAIFFGTMFYWLYVMYKGVKLRLMFEDGHIGGDDEPHVTGV